MTPNPNQFIPAIIIAVCFGALAAYLARQKKKPPFVWFLAGMLLGPLTLIALIVPERYQKPSPAWGYVFLAAFVGAVVWIGWRTMYAD